MVTHKANMAVLIIGLLSQQPILARGHNNDGFMDGLKTVGIIGGVVAGACAIGAGISYLCTPSNGKLISNGHSAESQARVRYGSLMRYFDTTGHVLREADLCGVAQHHLCGSIDSYTRDLQYEIDQVQYARNALNDRMYALDRKGERYTTDYRDMERLVDSLDILESSLRRVLQELKQHTPYFELYACRASANRAYGTALDIFDRYGNNHACLVQCLKEHVAVNGISNRNPYPTISYVETLGDKMSTMEKTLHRCSHNYDILMQVTALYTKLSAIRSVLLADDRYAYEVQAREQARREEARLQIERERACAAQRQADAAQRQADAAQKQAWEMERQNNILREQNRLERERMNRHRYCNHYACVCDMPAECPTIRIDVVL